jgi:hypothetical protein
LCCCILIPNRCPPPKAKKANYPNLQTFENVREIENKIKKFPEKFLFKKVKMLYKNKRVKMRKGYEI